ncbi:MAG: hypothetical protein RH982_13055 [Parvibaculum sp.]
MPVLILLPILGIQMALSIFLFPIPILGLLALPLLVFGQPTLLMLRLLASKLLMIDLLLLALLVLDLPTLPLLVFGLLTKPLLMLCSLTLVQLILGLLALPLLALGLLALLPVHVLACQSLLPPLTAIPGSAVLALCLLAMVAAPGMSAISIMFRSREQRRTHANAHRHHRGDARNPCYMPHHAVPPFARRRQPSSSNVRLPPAT